MKKIGTFLALLILLIACATPTETTEPAAVHVEATDDSGTLFEPACDLTEEGFTNPPVGTLFAVDPNGGVTPPPLSWDTETGTLSNADNSVSIAIQEGETISPVWPEEYAFFTGVTLRRCQGDLYIKYPSTHN